MNEKRVSLPFTGGPGRKKVIGPALALFTVGLASLLLGFRKKES